MNSGVQEIQPAAAYKLVFSKPARTASGPPTGFWRKPEDDNEHGEGVSNNSKSVGSSSRAREQGEEGGTRATVAGDRERGKNGAKGQGSRDDRQPDELEGRCRRSAHHHAVGSTRAKATRTPSRSCLEQRLNLGRRGTQITPNTIATWAVG
jgi:hypothetical protein